MNPLTLLLVVEQSLVAPLSPTLDTYIEERTKAGYTVNVIAAPSASTNYVQQTGWIRSNVWPALGTNTQVFLIGNVPMPRSGLSYNPDGHTTIGAYSAAGYYVAPSDKWTDTGTNFKKDATGNAPGDGKFDNHYFPTAPKAGLGMVNFPGATNNSALISTYLNKVNAYNAGQWAVIPIGLYAYPQNTATWANSPATVRNMDNAFGKSARYNAGTLITTYTKAGQAAYELVAYKTDNYAGILSRGAAPKSVVWLAWNSGQFEVRSTVQTQDVYKCLKTANGPLVVGLNHPDWTLDLKAGETWGNIWKTTFSKPNAPTWSWIMGDPTIVLSGSSNIVISSK